MRGAVFLDRDDTLIECRRLTPPPPPARPGDIVDPASVRLLPGVAMALRRLHDLGLALVVVSNQGVVARGGAALEQVEAINQRLRDEILAAGGPVLDGVYVCPYHPNGNVPPYAREHPWRKPGPGMLLAAAHELGLDLARSWLVGDADRDIDAGVAAGLPPASCLRVGEDSGSLWDLAAAADRIALALGGPQLVRGEEVLELTLEPRSPSALEEPRTRATVVATARSLAERSGLRLVMAAVDRGVLRVGLIADRFTGLGFLAELRRTTNRWHEARHGEALWPGDETRGDAP